MRAIVAAEEAGADPDAAAYAATPLDRDTVMLCLQRLNDGEFIEARLLHGDGRLMSVHVLKALPRALREVGAWPKAASPLIQKRIDRLAFMERLYQRTDGDPLQRVDARLIGGEFGWDEARTFQVAKYLADEGLLTFPVLGGFVAISHGGVVEVEQALVDPASPTAHFPPVNIINVFGNVVDSQLQAGGTDTKQERSARDGND